MKFITNSITKTLAACSMLALSSVAGAESLAIINATIHTAADQGVLKNSNVLIENGVITAIGAGEVKADTIVDAKGATLTPGLIAPVNQLGLVEVSAVSATRDYSDEKGKMTFTPSLAYNYNSTLIPYVRKGGITTAVITPRSGKGIYGGQSAVVNLTASTESVEVSEHGLVVYLGSKSKGSRAHSLKTLSDKLEDTAKALKKAEKKKKKDKDDEKEAKEPSREDQLLNAVVKGEKPLIVFANRATDLLHLIELKKQHELNLIIVGAADAVMIKEQLAKAEVPVVINPMSNLPSNFDSLKNDLTNAATLTQYGVKVILAQQDTHNLYQLRYSVGNAISYGLDRNAALKSMTATPAEAFGLDSGTIEVGKPADLVLWSGDMFELSSYVMKMWIDGKEYSTESRQDKLRDRYMKQSDMPKAYTK